MRSPGFEPGSSAWEADVLTKLDYDRAQAHMTTANRLKLCPNPFKIGKIVINQETTRTSRDWRSYV